MSKHSESSSSSSEDSIHSKPPSEARDPLPTDPPTDPEGSIHSKPSPAESSIHSKPPSEGSIHSNPSPKEGSTHSKASPPKSSIHSTPSPAESVESVESNEFQGQGHGRPQIFNICALDDHLRNVREILFGAFIQYPPECHCEEQWRKRQEEEHKKISNCDCGKENCGCECCACCNSTKAPVCGDDERKEHKSSLIRTEIPECLKKVNFVTVQNADIKTPFPAQIKCPLSPIAEMSCESAESHAGGCGSVSDINNNNVLINDPVPDANNNSVVEHATSEESIVVSNLKQEKVKGNNVPLLPFIKNIPIVPMSQVTVQKISHSQCSPTRAKKKSKGKSNKKAAKKNVTCPPPHPPAHAEAAKEKRRRSCSRGSNSSRGRSRSRSHKRCAPTHFCYPSSSGSDDDSSDSDSSSDDCGGGQENFPSEFLWFMLTMNSTAQYFKYNAEVSSQCAKAAAEANNNCCCPQQSNGNCPNQQGCNCNDPLTSVNVDTLDEIIEREGLNSFMDKEVKLTLKPFSGEYIPDNPLVDLKSLKMFAHGEKETDFCYETGGECECDKKKGKCCGGKKKNSDGNEDDEGGCCPIQLPPVPPCCCSNKLASENCCGGGSCAIGGTSARAPTCGTGGCSQVANCGSCGPPPCAPTQTCNPYNCYPPPCAPPQTCNPYNCYPQHYPPPCAPPPPYYPYPNYQYPYPSHYPYPHPPYHGYPYPPPPYPYYPQPCPPGNPCPNPCPNSCSNSCNPSPLELALTIGMSMGIDRVNAALAGCDGYADEDCDEEDVGSENASEFLGTEGGTRSNSGAVSKPFKRAGATKRHVSNGMGGARNNSCDPAGRARNHLSGSMSQARHNSNRVDEATNHISDDFGGTRSNFGNPVDGTTSNINSERVEVDCDEEDFLDAGASEVLSAARGTQSNFSNGTGGARSELPSASVSKKDSSSCGTVTRESRSSSSSGSSSINNSTGGSGSKSFTADTTGNLESNTQGDIDVQMVTVTTDRNNNRVRFRDLC